MSITFAVRGRCSQTWIPGTFEGIGLNSPLYSFGASGFMSKVSWCPQPPDCHNRITDRSFFGFAVAAARSTPGRFTPKAPSEPIFMKSRRPKISVRLLMAMGGRLLVVIV